MIDLVTRLQRRREEIGLSLETVKDELGDLWELVKGYPEAKLTSRRVDETAVGEITLHTPYGHIVASTTLGGGMIHLHAEPSGDRLGTFRKDDLNAILDSLARHLV